MQFERPIPDIEALLAEDKPFRQPKQARGLVKFNAMLDAAEALIVSNPDKDISLYEVAEKAGVAVGSVYHFFPSSQAICVALTERYDQEFAALLKPLSGPFECWQDILRQHVISVYSYINNSPASQYLLLGAGQNWATRTVDILGDVHIAQALAETIGQHFIIPDEPPAVDVLFNAIRMLEAFWGTSVQIHNSITEGTLTETLLAMETYLSLYWTDELPPR